MFDEEPVAFVPALCPKATLLFPLELNNDKLPTAVLLSPSIFEDKVITPTAVFSTPKVLSVKDSPPIAVLSIPSVFAFKASEPKAIL